MTMRQCPNQLQQLYGPLVAKQQVVVESRKQMPQKCRRPRRSCQRRCWPRKVPVQKRALERKVDGVGPSYSTGSCRHQLDRVTADILWITRHFTQPIIIRCDDFPLFSHLDVYKWTVLDHMFIDAFHDDFGYPFRVNLSNASFPTGTFCMVMTAITLPT